MADTPFQYKISLVNFDFNIVDAVMRYWLYRRYLLLLHPADFFGGHLHERLFSSRTLQCQRFPNTTAESVQNSAVAAPVSLAAS
jgi:hypothetical protein